jgi:hypothetical protein
LGKKYDAWIQASQAKREAEMDLAGAQGGSTGDRLNESRTNAQQGRINEEFTYQEWRQDPEG